jgi:hypothetical protein
VHRVVAGAGIPIAEDLDAREPDRGGDPVTVHVQVLERLVAWVVEIHLDAGDDLLQHRAWDGKCADRLLEPLPGGMRGGPPINAADLLAPVGELAPLLVAVLADVHGIVDDAAKGVHGVEGVTLPTGQAEEGVEEVRAALASEPRDELAGVHAALAGRGA